jgi:hypothetical protein
LVSFLKDGLGFGPYLFSFLTFVLFLLQALLFNRICANQKMFPKANFLPAMAFILISSLIPGWNYFSAPLVVNSLLLWTFYNLLLLYDKGNPVGVIYNIGFMMGLITLIFKPTILLLPLIWIALSIMRPFHIREWFVGLMGLLTPYYFMIVFLYLTGRSILGKVLPGLHFSFPEVPPTIYVTISIFLIVIGFLMGGFHMQNNLGKMLIQARKNWSMLLWILLLTSLMMFTSSNTGYSPLLLCSLPLAAFHGAGYFYSKNKYLPSLLYWVSLLFALYINYWVY